VVLRHTGQIERAVKTEDYTLIERFKAGDETAFKELAEKYYRKVYNVVLGMLRNPDDALDVTQDVFVKIYRNLKGFKGDSQLYTWMFRIAANQAIDHKRKLMRRESTFEYDDKLQTETPIDAPEDLLPDRSSGNPQAILSRKELNETIAAAMEKLGKKHREVIVLREIDGMSYEEIATTVNCSIGTVMSRLHHARKNLQKLLAGLSEEEEP
jgi:RNA polymerase sigma-70 factor, ECF subfamily